MTEKIEKKKNSKMLLVVIAAIIIVAAVIVAIVIGSKNNSSKKIAGLISQGEKYLSEMNYEQAIAVFEEIISIAPNRKEAYIGLADAYTGLAENAIASGNREEAKKNYEKARLSLEEGENNTGDEEIGSRLEEIKKIISDIEEEENKSEPKEEIIDIEEPVVEVVEPFSAEPYQELMGFYSNPSFYCAYNSELDIEYGSEDLDYTDNGWQTFIDISDEWGLSEKIAGLTDFSPCDDFVLSTFGDINYYSNRAQIATKDDVSIVIGYDDYDWGPGGTSLVHSGDYYEVTIKITIGENDYYFTLAHGG